MESAPKSAGWTDEQIPLIRVSSLAPIIEELDRRGGRGDALLADHLMTRRQLADPYQRIPLARYMGFLQAAAIAEGDDFLCARVGARFRPAHLGPVGLLFAASSNLRRGLQRLARWLNAWQDCTAVRVWDDEKGLVYSYRIWPEFQPRRQDSEYTLAATIAFARDAFGRAGQPVEVHLEHGAPKDAAQLTRILGIQPLFDQPDNRLIFDRAEADRSYRTEDRDLTTILERHVADLCQTETSPTNLTGKVRTFILMHLGHRPITLPMIASELGLSSRSLQRHLAHEGSSIRDLVKECRLELSRLHLREGRASNAEIAHALGYSDSTTFWRAFKSETGMTPSGYRKQG